MNFKNMFKVEKKHDIMQRITNKMPYRNKKELFLAFRKSLQLKRNCE